MNLTRTYNYMQYIYHMGLVLLHFVCLTSLLGNHIIQCIGLE